MIRLRQIACQYSVDLCIPLFPQLGSFLYTLGNKSVEKTQSQSSDSWLAVVLADLAPCLCWWAFVNTHSASAAHWTVRFWLFFFFCLCPWQHLISNWCKAHLPHSNHPLSRLLLWPHLLSELQHLLFFCQTSAWECFMSDHWNFLIPFCLSSFVPVKNKMKILLPYVWVMICLSKRWYYWLD